MYPLRLGSPVRLYTLLAIVVVAAIVPFAGVLAGLYNIWNLKPEYSHGIIIPVLSAYLIWRQREQVRQLPFVGSWLGVVQGTFGHLRAPAVHGDANEADA